LGDDAEEVIGGGVIVHFKAFDCFIVFDHWIE
jgi:hypothetical protein